MDMRYAKLKRKIVLLAAAGTLAATLTAAALLRLLDHLLGNLAQRLFVWAATCLFGQSQQTALEAYQHYIVENVPFFLVCALFFTMIFALYLVTGRFTRWLDEIAQAARQIAGDTGGTIALPVELQPLEQDLESIRKSLLEQKRHQEEMTRRRKDLTAFLAHDLKTPLTSVVGYLTLLRDQPELSAEQRAKFTGIALEKARRLEELLGEFFDITRMDLCAGQEEYQNIRLTVLLEQLADELYPQLGEKGLCCVTQLEQGLVVKGDPEGLARVFDNVLRNAIHYSVAGGEVRISARREGDMAEVILSNEGLEIPEGELARIFEKFYRLDAARSTRTGGAGLGLAIAKEIVERHGGTIRAESNGRYTSFVISLPLVQEALCG
ncbi:HAMP domain-containing histidine kinase [Pseudoflavonifractor phocaeensis]|uniref:sensor histidine kinase n=1 Tax=Pseudoflavonifractor phocaeensis TaxID=1870988 RepID=UPI0019575D14|nr:HAMP domain-containing sensor histidine kinase [Pseudoflavonifractor phocaeensis]MBM6870077.1 HAMP domain-containing histidine kinase [Pseudoflavonifractor phocaeensis]MBM6939127.1 HAMP domain-containing histidine kinase [Pseudoflavonifractor phocaeensis]